MVNNVLFTIQLVERFCKCSSISSLEHQIDKLGLTDNSKEVAFTLGNELSAGGAKNRRAFCDFVIHCLPTWAVLAWWWGSMPGTSWLPPPAGWSAAYRRTWRVRKSPDASSACVQNGDPGRLQSIRRTHKHALSRGAPCTWSSVSRHAACSGGSRANSAA